MAGLLKPAAARVLVKALKRGDRPADPLPHARHVRHRGGDRAGGGRGRRRRGRRRDGCDVRPHLAAEPRLDRRGAARHRARHRPRPRGDPPASRFYWEAVRNQYAAFESDLRAGASEVYLHEMPGGQFTNLKEQARSLGPGDALARGGAGLCRGQPDVRRHRQGDAVVQGRRRHGADDGDART